MVKRILTFITTEIRGLHEAAYLLAIFAFLSQVLALVRDKLLAFNFGAGEVVDMYYAAFRIPDFVFVTVATLVSASVIVPFLVEKIENGHTELHAFIREITTLFGALMIVVGGIAWFAMPYLVDIALPGFTDDSFKLVVQASRIMLLSPILLGISNILGSIAQAHHRFALFALSPIFYNVGIIFGIIILYPRLGYTGLIWGVVVGAFLHMAIQLPFVFSQKLIPFPVWPVSIKNVSRVLMLSVPRTIAISANQFMLLTLTAGASLVGKGAVAALSFAWNLQAVPLTIIGVSYSSAAFPTLARLYTAGDTNAFVKQLVTSARHIIFWSLVISVLFIVLRAQIVRVVLGSGQFDWSDTRITAAMLALFAVSAVAQSLILLFTRAFYAIGQTIKPLIINVGGAALIFILSAFALRTYTSCETCSSVINELMKVQGIAGTGILSLAIAYSIGTILTMIVLWLTLERQVTAFTQPLLRTLFDVSSASIIMGYVTYIMLRPLSEVFPLTTVTNVFFQGFFAGCTGIVVGIGVLLALKNMEIAEIWKAFHAKIWKAQIVKNGAEL